MKRLYIFTLLILSGCQSPEDVAYCKRLGITPNHSEYANCMQYFHTQNNAFQADYAVCSAEADKTYPRSLYDEGDTVWSHGGYWGDNYSPGELITIEPDAEHNAEVDNLRQRIIRPCMQSRGWKSGTNWEAGRMKPMSRSAMPKNSPAAKPLPWLKP
jgi:hypothetical protein